MSDTEYVCGVETRPVRMYENPEPAEYCMEPVENEDEPCARHEEDDEPDWDNIREDRAELERERHADGYYDNERLEP